MPERPPMAYHGSQSHCLVKVEHVADEQIWMSCLDPEWRQQFAWKMLYVERHDDIGTPSDSSCQDVPVVRIGENQLRDQGFMADYQRILDRLIHQGSSAKQFGCKLRSGPQHTAGSLLMDLV